MLTFLHFFCLALLIESYQRMAQNSGQNCRIHPVMSSVYCGDEKSMRLRSSTLMVGKLAMIFRVYQCRSLRRDLHCEQRVNAAGVLDELYQSTIAM